ncbi:MAG TPA: ATP-dependent metallopeptidase FtsH/Yme1/Tma family protein [Burkholderiales bacterium]|nr:ATP-dependent metallopeptidase FtsH/Yme1/Tma family protein [Burkholderiales bacterium]
MTQANATQDISRRPWWRASRVWWFIAIAVALGLAVGAVVEKSGRSAAMPYGAFLDRLEAGNVASVTFQGTEIDGRLKHPSAKEPSSDAAQEERFSSRVPDFGDPALIPELRKQHVVIDVGAPSQWTLLFARLPWPMLAFLVVVLIAALARLIRGEKAAPRASMAMQPGGGMIELVSGFFAKKHETEDPTGQKRADASNRLDPKMDPGDQ